jgi:hypothetical protein
VKKPDIDGSDNSMRMFVGLNVHKKCTEVAIVDEEGVIEKQRVVDGSCGSQLHHVDIFSRVRHCDRVN